MCSNGKSLKDTTQTHRHTHTHLLTHKQTDTLTGREIHTSTTGARRTFVFNVIVFAKEPYNTVAIRRACFVNWKDERTTPAGGFR